MIVRAATPKDAAAIAAIQNPFIRETAVTFNSVERSEAEVADAVRAAPSYDQFRKGAGYARTMEHTIVLAPDAQGLGIGRALMTALEDHARAAGVGSLWAGVSAENPSGVAFHARLGYSEVARLPRVGYKFGRWMDLVLMCKWLLPEGDGGDGSL